MVFPDSGGGGSTVMRRTFDSCFLAKSNTAKKKFMALTLKHDEIKLVTTIKEEKEDENNGSSSVSLPKPMEGLHESGPPPFLKKTLEMVEDSETDAVVSWSKNLDSFIVWDSHEFSKTLLPKYFKHSNFSSFIRQLNTYGFRKIDSDRWEFANEGFRRGKKHLLKNIRRRSRSEKQKNRPTTTRLMNATMSKPGLLETELNSLISEENIMRAEILRLKQQQQESCDQINAVRDRIRSAEYKQLQMFFFFVKATKNPGVI